MSKVHPFLDPQVISKLAGLPLEARHPMMGNVSGRHRSPVRGSSLEFAEYRKYVPGDDTRRLDWRVWGRTDRFYIKEFEADTNLRMCVVVDTSGSMQYGPGGSTRPNDQKLHYARKLAGTLAWLATQQGDAVGLYCAAQKLVKEIPPRRGTGHLKMILDQLQTAEAGGETGLVETLHQVAEKISRRAMVVVISDLFLDPSEFVDCFQHLRYRKHDVVLFHLLDQEELDFKFGQPMKFVDLEGGLPMLADPALVADAYQNAVESYFVEIDEMVRAAQVDYHRTLLQQDHGEVLANFLNSRIARS